jgi:dihydrofolate reductase
MIVSHIVAAGEKNEIGKDNRLLWHLPNDLKFFKNTTWGMPLIMGRKTYESIAGEPLPGRTNIVVTQNPAFDPGSGRVRVADTVDKAILLAAETDCREVFIAGGGEIYRHTLPLAHRIYLTRIHHAFPEAGIFYPEIRGTAWRLVRSLSFPADDKHAWSYTFETWER